MPGLDGLELCRRIRAADVQKYTYIVLVTSLSNPSDVLDGMHAGADDYVAKPLNPFDLETRLLAARRVTSLHAELARARADLTRLAATDPLTGLRNRLHLSAELEQLHAVSQRYGRSYCAVLADVDHFKRYNDTYGHPAGDEVLRAVGTVLRVGVRAVDRAFRYGGEEFLLLLPEQTAAGAVIAVERLLQQVRGLSLEHRTGGSSGLVTMSFGIAACAAGAGLTASAVVDAADSALYTAKDTGRDRLAVAGTAQGGAATGGG